MWRQSSPYSLSFFENGITWSSTLCYLIHVHLQQSIKTLWALFPLQELKALVAQHNVSTSKQPGSSRTCFPGGLPSSQSQRKYHLEKVFVVSQAGNCRVMAYCDSLSCLVVSQPSPQSTFIPGKWAVEIWGFVGGTDLQKLNVLLAPCAPSLWLCLCTCHINGEHSQVDLWSMLLLWWPLPRGMTCLPPCFCSGILAEDLWLFCSSATSTKGKRGQHIRAGRFAPVPWARNIPCVAGTLICVLSTNSFLKENKLGMNDRNTVS